MNKPICIPTIFGDIVAYACSDTSYPGVHIFLRRNGIEILIACVEAEHVFDHPSLNYQVYGDLSSDIPTISDRIFPDEIDDAFSSIADNN